MVEEFDAWADESYACPADRTDGVYVVAAVTFDRSPDDVRAEMLDLRGPRPGKLHWSEMSTDQRLKVVETVAGFGGFHVVAAAAPVSPRRAERARARCLTRVVHELYGDDRHSLCAESRQPVLDKRDRRIVQVARAQLSPTARFFIGFARGDAEPLLWPADVVAGAVRAARQGEDQRYREVLRHVVYEVEITDVE